MQVIASTENIEEPPVEMGDVRTILVKDFHGNPIFLAMQQDDDNIWAVTPDDARFNELIEELGISKRITVKHASI